MARAFCLLLNQDQSPALLQGAVTGQQQKNPWHLCTYLGLSPFNSQPGQPTLTQHHCILLPAEVLLQPLLQGIEHHVQQVAGSQGHLLMLHAQHRRETGGPQFRQDGHGLQV